MAQARLGLHADLLEEYTLKLRRLNRSERTIENYVGATRRLLAVYPDVTVESFTPEHIERALWDRRLSPLSIVVELSRLRVFFAWCKREKRLIKRNPCADVDKPAVPETHRRAPYPQDFLRMCRATRTLEEAAMLEFLYHTGARINEFRHIRCGDCDLTKRRVLLTQGKGRRPRTVVFPPHVADLLTNYGDGLGPDRFLFHTLLFPDRRRSVKWIERTLRRLGQDAGLSYPVTAHVIRHGWFLLMKLRKVPSETTARLGGHRDSKTTERIYGWLAVDDLQDLYDQQVGEGV